MEHWECPGWQDACLPCPGGSQVLLAPHGCTSSRSHFANGKGVWPQIPAQLSNSELPDWVFCNLATLWLTGLRELGNLCCLQLCCSPRLESFPQSLLFPGALSAPTAAGNSAQSPKGPAVLQALLRALSEDWKHRDWDSSWFHRSLALCSCSLCPWGCDPSLWGCCRAAPGR